MAPLYVVEAWSRTGRPFPSTPLCVNTQPSLASRVRALSPAIFPTRPSVSAVTLGTPVPSISMYSTGISGPRTVGSSSCSARCLSACSPAAISPPMASAWRSTALVVTCNPASASSCSRPCAKLPLLPTSASMRRTPGENSSLGLCPWWQEGAQVIRPFEPYRSYRRKNFPRSHLVETGCLATLTGSLPLETFRGPQQFLEDLGAHLVRRRANAHLDRFQIEPITLPQPDEDHFQ